jgi:hypothetical protein
VTIRVPRPSLQVDFAARLAQSRAISLQPALANTVRQTEIAKLDAELSKYVLPPDLASLASRGIRGEWVFPVPLILSSNPHLLAYYRLLLGFSQKQFYTSASGLSQFRPMEDRGQITPRSLAHLGPLCSALVEAASYLCREIGYDRITVDLLDDLTLLTLGPQLRGGANVRRGTDAISQVLRVIQAIVSPYLIDTTATRLRLKNAPGREVVIRFASDPDIVIHELRSDGREQLIVAIEVKGGRDFSNIHNRVGEAEKSHQKARQRGYTECWTVVNVPSIDLEMARKESPSTDQFFLLDDLLKPETSGYAEFHTRLIHLTSIPDSPVSAKNPPAKRSRRKTQD